MQRQRKEKYSTNTTQTIASKIRGGMAPAGTPKKPDLDVILSDHVWTPTVRGNVAIYLEKWPVVKSTRMASIERYLMTLGSTVHTLVCLYRSSPDTFAFLTNPEERPTLTWEKLEVEVGPDVIPLIRLLKRECLNGLAEVKSASRAVTGASKLHTVKGRLVVAAFDHAEETGLPEDLFAFKQALGSWLSRWCDHQPYAVSLVEEPESQTQSIPASLTVAAHDHMCPVCKYILDILKEAIPGFYARFAKLQGVHPDDVDPELILARYAQVSSSDPEPEPAVTPTQSKDDKSAELRELLKRIALADERHAKYVESIKNDPNLTEEDRAKQLERVNESLIAF